MDLTKVGKWQIQDGSVLNTREVFAKIIFNEIDSSQLCRSETSKDWYPIQTVFYVIHRYGILKELGSGAFGNVYLAFEARKRGDKQGRLVAIKKPTQSVLKQYAKESGKHNDEVWARMAIGQAFSQEALLTARLAMSPNVVKVLDHNVTVPYVVLEFCNGGTLAERLSLPYDAPSAISWATEIARALSAAHNLQPDNLVHRDLKPQNVLLHNNHAKVSDFGTSKMAYQAQSLRSLEGGYTPKYAAPEVLDGKAYPSTDIWSFGVILYQMLSGRAPFEGEGMVQLMKKITCDSPTPVSTVAKLQVDSSIHHLIDRCLTKDPHQRPTAEECVQILQKNSATPSTVNIVSKKETVGNTKTKIRQPLRHSRTRTRNISPAPRRKPTKPQPNNSYAAMMIFCVLSVGAFIFFLTYIATNSHESIDVTTDDKIDNTKKTVPNKPTDKPDSKLENTHSTKTQKTVEEPNKPKKTDNTDSKLENTPSTKTKTVVEKPQKTEKPESKPENTPSTKTKTGKSETESSQSDTSNKTVINKPDVNKPINKPKPDNGKNRQILLHEKSFAKQVIVKDRKPQEIYSYSANLEKWDVDKIDIVFEVEFQFTNRNGTPIHQFWSLKVGDQHVHEYGHLYEKDRGPYNRKEVVRATIPKKDQLKITLVHYVISGIFYMNVSAGKISILTHSNADIDIPNKKVVEENKPQDDKRESNKQQKIKAQKWKKWQQQMQKDFDYALTIHKKRNSSTKKKQWKKFVEKYQVHNNPFSDEDQQLLQKAKEYLSKLNTSRKDKFSGFTYKGKKTYKCKGIKYNVARYKHNKTGMMFVLVPGGTFKMGSEYNREKYPEETPVHTVTLKSFLIAQTEVTQPAWLKVMKSKPWRGKPYAKEGKSYPASHISWYDANEFCQKSGLELPTEAQWEYACRAGSSSNFYWGESADFNYLWFYENAEAKGSMHAQPVGYRLPNAFGLFDMSGNLLEWCLDYYDGNYYQRSPQVNPLESAKGGNHVYRGGWWSANSDSCRSSMRSGKYPSTQRAAGFGFRPCKNID
ncbi:bifunctional serine/threonine-protein kinase/formylglycine-generating enzyme family protein [Candidatus Uabimicrobium amorphum]|uniref:non-specific serine/threonine protein kinase n=1 Tax=Uabimicrobium amorphum TaxID=2596890 RepID=A0A5S9IQ02_UABAM|nr:bifunctional serine/threonine-protein kinase/formylglycine-generating enzyme family protein [Candidatus Uabimicrobium amorphum]BBM85331.1 hypothetical protein UABAM_03697 [Candidatus Uabimicrobium amorphum]